MRTLIIPAALALLSASAIAGPVWVAVPVQPSSMSRFVGNSVAWVCGESGCSSVTDITQAVSMAECKAVARQVGKLASFSTTKGPFPDGRLADCNEAARATSKSP
jgi:hypothetical protein